MKTVFQKLKPKFAFYRYYGKFSNKKFRKNVLTNLSKEKTSTSINSLERFLQLYISKLDQFAPQKIHNWQ